MNELFARPAKLREHRIKMWIVKIAWVTAESQENIFSLSQSITYSDYEPTNWLSKRALHVL